MPSGQLFEATRWECEYRDFFSIFRCSMYHMHLKPRTKNAEVEKTSCFGSYIAPFMMLAFKYGCLAPMQDLQMYLIHAFA
jgi:hypothetical protein